MQATTLSLLQLAWTGSRESMMNQYRDLIPQAVAQGASLIGLPEFSLTPYFPGTTDPSGFDWAEPLHGGPSDLFFGEMAKKHQVTIVASLFETDSNLTYDTATFHDSQGKLTAFTRKIHIPSGMGYHETHFFQGYHEYPVIHVGTVNMAAPTCYDQWFPEVARIYSMNGAELIFYPTAIGSEPNDPTLDSSEQWQTVMRGHAIANGVFIGAANRVGQENSVTFYGSSFICDPRGRILAQAGRDTTEIITATLDPQVLNQWREFFPLLHQRRPQTYQRLLDKTVKTPPPAWLEVDAEND